MKYNLNWFYPSIGWYVEQWKVSWTFGKYLVIRSLALWVKISSTCFDFEITSFDVELDHVISCQKVHCAEHTIWILWVDYFEQFINDLPLNFWISHVTAGTLSYLAYALNLKLLFSLLILLSLCCRTKTFRLIWKIYVEDW